MASAAGPLQRAGLRPTAQRLAVLEHLIADGGPMTAGEVHHALRATGGGPGLATVYRTLQALADAGELDVFDRGGEQAFRRCRTEHHHHLVCTSCGEVTEVDAEEVEAWVARVSKRRRFTVTGHRADIFGSCAGCSRA